MTGVGVGVTSPTVIWSLISLKVVWPIPLTFIMSSALWNGPYVCRCWIIASDLASLMPFRVISSSLSAVLILIFSAVDNGDELGEGDGFGDTDGDTFGDTKGSGDKLGDSVGDTFLSPLVSPSSVTCGLPTSNACPSSGVVGSVDNSISLTSDVLWPSEVANSSVTDSSSPPPSPNKLATCAQKFGFFCSLFAK